MRTTKVVSISATPAEIALWRRASGGELSVWIREHLNAACDGMEPEPPVSAAQAPDIAALIREAVASALAAQGVPEATQAYVPTPIPELPAGAKNVPISPEDAERYRHRGQVAAFLRLDGQKWLYPGPSPFEPGCLVRADVLAEYADRLDDLRDRLRFDAAQMGVAPEMRV